ncbi:hypothetical protein ACFLT2_14840 [Acidobacteriota bacterium]
MKKTILVLIILSLCFIPFIANSTTADSVDSSNPGVKFEDLTYAEVLTKAQKENKYVLVEFYSPT